jgi:Domain of unknown function (DUF5060)/Fibronectin type III domain
MMRSNTVSRMWRSVITAMVLGFSLASTSALGGSPSSDAPLSYSLLRTEKPHDAPSVVLCRGQLFASSNSSGITRIDPNEMRILEVHDYPDVGVMHQLTTDGRMLYVAYFTETCSSDSPMPCTSTPTHGILKVDPADLSVVAQLRLEEYGVEGWPEGFVWHDGYLYEAAFGLRGMFECRIPKIEPNSMTFAGAVALPNLEGCHGMTYDGSKLYALGVPPTDSTSLPDHFYRIDPDTLEIEATLTFPDGLHHYGGNVFLRRNGYIYTSPGFPEETRGALVKIDPGSFTVVDVLKGGGRHWLATEGRYLYLVEGEAVRAIDPDAMVTLGHSTPPFDSGVATLHYGYVAEDGNLYLGFENDGGRGFVGKMVTLSASDRTAPSAATSVEAGASGGVVELRWTAAEDAESAILAYRIYRGVLGSEPAHLVTLPAASVRFTDRSAQPGTTYVYELAAINGAGIEGPHQPTAPVKDQSLEVRSGDPFEITLRAEALPDEAWAEAEFTSPSGSRYVVRGAYDGPGTWKVRFYPRESGPWRFAVSSNDKHLVKFGGFEVATSRAPSSTRLRSSR